MLPDFTFFNRSPWYDIFCDVGKFFYAKAFRSFGVLIIAFVTSVGGGTVRDLLLDVPVFDARFISREFDFFHCYFYDDIQIN